ncbi:hypothetical protein [Subtercola sp. YIM 133946]|uniref:hypothetical protein n=1 Tax=Subtercola sp. YIM 133946 TaxID=3118909 RepID=UPI002F936738
MESGTADGATVVAGTSGVNTIGATGITPNTGTITFSNLLVWSGLLGIRFLSGAGAQCLARFPTPANSMTMSMGVPFAVEAKPATNATVFAGLRYASGYACRVQWSASNIIQVFDSASGNILNVMTGAVPGAQYWLSIGVVVATSTTGYILVEVYNWAGVLLGSATSSAYNLGTAALVTTDVGIINTNPTAGTGVRMDFVQFNSDNAAGIKPPASFTASVGLSAAAALATPARASFATAPALQAAAALGVTGSAAHAATPAFNVPVAVSLEATSHLNAAAGLSSSVTLAPAGSVSSSASVATASASALAAQGAQAAQAAAAAAVVPVLTVGASSAHSTGVDTAAELQFTAEAFASAFGLADLLAMVTLTVAEAATPHDLVLIGSVDTAGWAGTTAEQGYTGTYEDPGWQGTS